MTRCACGRTWTSLIECHCATCHRHFTAVGSFDMHRSDDQCHDPVTRVRRDGRPRLLPVERPNGVVWASWRDPDALPEAWRRSKDAPSRTPRAGSEPLSPTLEGSHTGEAS